MAAGIPGLAQGEGIVGGNADAAAVEYSRQQQSQHIGTHIGDFSGSGVAIIGHELPEQHGFQGQDQLIDRP